MPPIRKAVIPAAGFGTRLFPASKAVKKALFPIIDRQGRAKPIIMTLVEEALSAGIESVAIVVQPEDQPLFADFFHVPPQGDYRDKLLPKYAAEMQYLQELGDRITFVTQPTQDGFGHAVYCAQEWVNQEPFLLLLGDHIYISDREISSAAQLLQMFDQTATSTISIEPTPLHTISHRGCIMGTWQDPDRLLRITQLVEKPPIEYAQTHLHVAGMPADQLLAVSGMYALMPQIFDYLADQIQRNQRENGEFQLTSALDRLRHEHGMMGYCIEGRSFDTGQPDYYWQAVLAFRQKAPNLP